MYKPTVPQRYVQHGPTDQVFFLAKKGATRVTIQKEGQRERGEEGEVCVCVFSIVIILIT